MNILIYRWNVFNQEDIKEAFEYFGHSVKFFQAPSFKGEVSEEKLRQDMHAMREAFSEYDIIFSVNYFSQVSDLCQDIGKPYLSWTVDSPMLTMYHQSVYNSCNYIFLFDRFQYIQFKNMGVAHVFYLPLAVNAERVQHQLKTVSGSAGTESFLNEIAFVGGLYHKNSYDAIKPALTDYLRGYFDAAMEAQMDIYGDNIFDDLLNVDILSRLSELIDFKKEERSFSDIKLVFTSTYLGYKLAHKERIKYLTRLGMKYRVGVYTDEPDEQLKNVEYRGTVNYLHDMPAVFNQSKINLNLTIRNIRTGIPLRVWDILGAGGFALTNYQVELDSYFKNGRDIVYFDGIEDCLRKAEYYLEHEAERIEIAANGLKKVKERHSYINRIEQMLRNCGFN
ncbi:MAG: DUF3880 domain-containing protein [Eubacteriales bacterium]|nr:DUF3880 domain-containing protein [Eubacteriales bacterium]